MSSLNSLISAANSPRKCLYLALGSGFLLSLGPVHAGNTAANLQNGKKIRVSDPATAQGILEAGGQLVADYGAFKVLRVNEEIARAAASLPAIENVTEENLIWLNAGALDTTTPEVIAMRSAAATTKGTRLHLIQFSGPIKSEWRTGLDLTGVRVVAYIPNNTYLVYGSDESLNQLRSWAAQTPNVQWEGDFQDTFKIHPRAGTLSVKGNKISDTFEIQLVADPTANAATLAKIDALKLEPVRQQFEFLGYLNVIVHLPIEALVQIAAFPEVVSIQIFDQPRKRDERQNQILAHNLTGDQPTGPGYLAWITGKGFTQAQFTLSGFAVDLTDSGIDNATTSPGHFGLYPIGDTGQPSRIIYNRLEGTPNSGSTLEGCDGHGTLNSHIIAGFNDEAAGFPHTDSGGFRYGLGICPWVKVGSSVIFDPDLYTSPNLPNLQSKASNDGARLSSNSWGANTGGGYNVNAQTYDALVRDSQPAVSTFPLAGNQEMVIIFAAGNAGPGGTSVGAPGTAKNVITVGAAENARSMNIANGGNTTTGDDGCATADVEGNSANDIVGFSSRGPCTDGRKKPDICAPGSHVTGGVAQNSPPPAPGSTGSALACFAASGVCALPGGGIPGSASNYFPINQQFYTESSGTSHSTPAVAGCAALLRQDFINHGLTPPSPAMTKAFLMNSARYMTGVGANDTLWSANQGMGEADLSVALDGVARVLRDQVTLEKFTAPGQSRTYAGTVPDPSKPFRVTLAWTDAPGSTSGNSYNNNLDLVVTVGGNTFKGNVFSGANSVTGGAADFRNNVESVFLPAGLSGPYIVTATAANIPSDGVPNEDPAQDQDFALVIYNANETPTPVISGAGFALAAESCGPTNGAADPNETVTVLLGLQNVGTSNTTSVVATLLPGNGLTSPSAPQNYGALLAGSGTVVTQSFTFSVTGACGTIIAPTLHIQDGAVDLGNVAFNMSLGVPATTISENFDGVVAPALPGSWTRLTSGAASNWVTSVAQRDTLPNAAFCADAGGSGVNELDSPLIVVPSAGTQLSFRHSYTTESGWDGCVLEIKIGGGAYTDILTAGGTFAAGGYNGTINTGSANPLTGRPGWSGSSGGFITTTVNIPATAAGQNVQFRWRLGSDASVGATGWFVDTVSIIAPSCCGVVNPPVASFTAAPTLGGPPLAVAFSDTSFGAITNRFWDFGNGQTTNTTATSFIVPYVLPGTYTVSLTASSPAGTNSLTRTAYITVTNTVLPVGYAIVSESCTNGALDPVESVTVNFSLRNAGSSDTTSLVATLLPSGNILSPSGPQNYGTLIAGGPAVSRAYSFLLGGTCGGTNLATLQLQDGPVNLGTISIPLPLGAFAVVAGENFDSVSAPLLPAGWSSTASGAQSFWVTSPAVVDSAPNAAFSTDASNIGVNELVSAVTTLPVGPAQLRFRHNYNLEAPVAGTSCFDGGVLEIKIGAGAFADIIAAGGSFVSGNYNRTIGSIYNNPLAGRAAWSSTSGGFTNTIINLPAAASGQNIQLRWRCASDSSIGATGWYVDTITINALTCCSSPFVLIPTPPAGYFPFGFNVLGGAGDVYAIEGTTNFQSWQQIQLITNVSGTVPFSDSNSPVLPIRLYRARRVP